MKSFIISTMTFLVVLPAISICDEDLNLKIQVEAENYFAVVYPRIPINPNLLSCEVSAGTRAAGLNTLD